MGPIIFLTIITGIIRLEDLKTLGSLGVKTVLYFEIVSTFALVIGVLFGEILKPGAGMHLDTASLDTKSVQGYIEKGAAQPQTAGDEIWHILQSAIPHDPISPLWRVRPCRCLLWRWQLRLFYPL